jgi:hypothetical protein
MDDSHEHQNDADPFEPMTDFDDDSSPKLHSFAETDSLSGGEAAAARDQKFKPIAFLENEDPTQEHTPDHQSGAAKDWKQEDAAWETSTDQPPSSTHDSTQIFEGSRFELEDLNETPSLSTSSTETMPPALASPVERGEWMARATAKMPEVMIGALVGVEARLLARLEEMAADGAVERGLLEALKRVSESARFWGDLGMQQLRGLTEHGYGGREGKKERIEGLMRETREREEAAGRSVL